MTTWTNEQKTGWAWQYNQPDMEYNQEFFGYIPKQVFYNSIGEPTDWENQQKTI
jgi:hypothetical protein